MVRHLATVEQFWFRRTLAGQEGLRLYRSADGKVLEFDGAIAEADVVAEAWDSWRSEVSFARQVVAEAGDLGTAVPIPGGNSTISVREVLAHMIEEYSRHLGHADFLRERIGGRVGQ